MKDAKLALLHAEATARLRRFRTWSARHVPRSQNGAADALANEALDRVAAGGPAVVVRRPTTGTGSAGDRPPPAPVQLEAGFDPGDAGDRHGPLRVTILGSGTSGGVPRIACPCPTCTSADPRDRRTRASALLAYGDARVVIDVGPDFRAQALAAGLERLDAVLLTHEHNDAVAGLDDLRRYNDLRGGYVPIHALAETFEVLVPRFAYAFEPGRTAFRGIPMLRPVTVSGPFQVEGRTFVPVPIVHFDRPILGYRTGSFAYLSDVKRVEATSMALLHDLDVLVIEALREEPHPGHQTVTEALAVIEELRPRRAWLTHLDHELRHADLAARLPAGVGVAFDGLVIDVDR